jgi:hypothetical protein
MEKRIKHYREIPNPDHYLIATITTTIPNNTIKSHPFSDAKNIKLHIKTTPLPLR